MENNERIFLEFAPNDFIVRISPIIDTNGTWTGELEIGTCTTDENNLSDGDYVNLMQLTQMLLSTIPAMEDDEYIRDTLYKLANSVVEKEEAPQRKLESIDGNIINVKFK
tara:strand:+ start:529 stop:858 length:330 start_codon:yes stop_codon:yes gene_type:complete